MQRSAVLNFLCLFIISLFTGGMTATAFAKATDTKSALLLSEINKSFPDSSDVKHRIESLIQRAKENQNTPEVAIAFADEALRLASVDGFEIEASNAQHLLGTIAWANNNYEDAAGYFYQSKNLREQAKDSIALVESNIQIGYIYLKQNHFDDAQYYFDIASQISKKTNDAKSNIDVDIALGTLFFHKEENKKSESYIHKALTAAQSLGYEQGQINAYLISGQLHLAAGDFIKAHEHFEIVLQEAKESKRNHLLITILPLIAHAKIYIKSEKPKVERLLRESVQLVREMKLPERELEILTILSNIYQRNHSFEKAFFVEKERYALSQQLSKDKLESAIAEVLANSLTREKKMTELQSSMKLLENRQKISQLYQTTALICVASIFVIIGFSYSRLRLQTKSNLLLSEKNKELEEKNSALERFAYVASHDLKEPLRTISSFASLIARKYQPLLDDKGKEYIKFITDGTSHMNFLLEDLLRYSRLVNKKDFVAEPVNLNQIVASVENVLSHKIGERNASIRYPDMPVVFSNSLHMHQLFQNLIANGLKFNDKEVPVVEISCTPEDDQYLIAIKDNGIGIDKQYHKKIFEMFQRLSKNEYNGTGIGLSICQKIMEINEGKLWLESQVGEGTTFYFYLPKAQAN